MVWLAYDPVAGRELVLVLPRVQPPDPAAVETWLRDAKHAARLEHPHLVPAVEIGAQNNWPFATYDRAVGVTLREHVAANPETTAVGVADWAAQVLQALAFAHEAGVAHGDIQLQHLVIDDKGRARVIGLATGGGEASGKGPGAGASALDAAFLEAQRAAARRDLVGVGVLIHRLLLGHPILDEEDIGIVSQRIDPPLRSLVKLPWNTPQPVSQGLRAIANRSTERLPKQRYQTARTFLNAIEAWSASHVADESGPIEVLIDRLHTVGLLPALPGVAECVAHLALMEGQRTDEIAVEVLGDMALSFELLRRVNSAQVRSTQAMGNGPVLTMRRCVALLGLEGIRFAAQGLRTWPGPLAAADADLLARLLERTRLAGYVAQALRPAGYDAEVVFLIVAMQSIGRLMVQYHFADEAVEIHRMMQPTPGTPLTGGLEVKGLTEDAATIQVLGVDLETLAAAVFRHWGLPDEMMHLARRLSPERPVRTCETDDDLLRTTASAALELVDAHQLPAAKIQGAVLQVAQRYGRVLSIAPRDLGTAMEGAKRAMRTTGAMPLPEARTDAEADADEADATEEVGVGEDSTP
ncbi:hypothetical protein BH09PSE5_BH09PSE5_01710 [soil metagenome]